MRFTRLLLCLICVATVLAGCGSPEERAAEHLETAQDLFDSGDYINARLEAQNAAQIEPKDAGARYLLALIAEQDGQVRAMLQHLLIAVESDPDLLAARIKLGTLYVSARAYEPAAEQAAAAMALAPDAPDVRVLNARLLIQQGQLEPGRAELEQALTLDPTHVEAIGMKALLLQESEPDCALELLDDAIDGLERDEAVALRQLKLDILESHERTGELEQALRAMIDDAGDVDSTYQARLADFYRRQGRVDEAEGMLRELAAAASENSVARLDVIQFLAEVRTPEDAARALRDFISEDPENQELRLAIGDLYLGENRREDAMASFRDAAALDPVSQPGLLARAKLAADRMQQGDNEEAGKIVAGILADAPADSRALLMRAGLRFNEQRYDEAIADLRVLLRNEPGNQNALLLLARSHIAADEIILGKDIYRRLLDLNPSLAVATQELVTRMVQDDEVDEAEAVLDKLTSGESGNTAAEILKIELLLQRKDWPAAEAAARRLVAGTDPNGVGAFQLGQVLEAREQYAEAAQAYAEALEKSTNNLRMMQGLARTMNAQGKQVETIAFLRRRATDFPDNTGIRLMLGGALADRGETAEALRIFESVIDDQPNQSPPYVAVASLFPDDADKRIAAYRRGLAAVPGNLPIASLLVDEYQRLDRVDDLVALYEELLAVSPGNQQMMNNLAALLADRRFTDPDSLQKAVRMAERLVDTDDPLIMDTVGWVYYRSGDAERAVTFLERSASAVDLPIVRYHLGMAYLAAGDRAAARVALESATGSNVAAYDGIEAARAALAGLDRG